MCNHIVKKSVVYIIIDDTEIIIKIKSFEKLSG